MRRSWMVVAWVLIGFWERAAEVEASADVDEPALVAIERNAQTEFFALRTVRPEEVGSSTSVPQRAPVPSTRTSTVGGCALTRSQDGDSWALQLDIELPLEATRVLQVETSKADGRACIWRELRAATGRTITFGVRPEGTKAIDWSPSGIKRKLAWPDQRGLGLLELIELVRLDSPDRIPAKARWIDPLAANLIPVAISLERAGATRRVEVHTSAGDRVAQVTFDGSQLTTLAWQAGGLIAERISAEAHARLVIDRRRSASRIERTE